jgi:hypothetical protein
MKKTPMRQGLSVLAAMMLLGGLVGPALCATLSGMVRDAQGQPISGAELAVKGSTGQTIARGWSDAAGRYSIGGLSAGTVNLSVSQTGGAYRAGSGVVTLKNEGGTANWFMSKNAPALGTENSRPDPMGQSFAEHGQGDKKSCQGREHDKDCKCKEGDDGDHRKCKAVSPDEDDDNDNND